MTQPKLGARGLAVQRGGYAILDVQDLSVLESEVLALVGPNGAGKSTLIHILALLDRPSAGQVLFDGQPVQGGLLRYRRRMAVVFQEPLLLDASVEANVGSGLALRGVSGRERAERVRRWLQAFGIEGLAGRSARTLSGGEAQRTSLARALALEPEVILLDEPFAALDAPTRQGLIEDLDRVLGETGTTTVFVTHDRGEALRLGDRVAVMMAGRIRQVGPVSQVFAEPADQEVAAFLGVETIIPGQVRSREEGLMIVEVCGRRIEVSSSVESSGEVLVCLRPEDVVLSPADDQPPHSSVRNRLPAVVRRVVNAGAQARVEIDAGFPLVALITKQSLEDLSLAPGSQVVASFKATAVHLISRHPRPSG